MPSRNSQKRVKKLSCPFKVRHCITDSTVCGYIGYYKECPKVIK